MLSAWHSWKIVCVSWSGLPETMCGPFDSGSKRGPSSLESRCAGLGLAASQGHCESDCSLHLFEQWWWSHPQFSFKTTPRQGSDALDIRGRFFGHKRQLAQAGFIVAAAALRCQWNVNRSCPPGQAALQALSDTDVRSLGNGHDFTTIYKIVVL